MTWRQMIRADEFRAGDEIVIKGHPCVVVGSESHWGTNARNEICRWVWIKVSYGPGGVQAFRPHRRLAGKKAFR
jgi:translation elongation factor P/translation initiation factor 5A